MAVIGPVRRTPWGRQLPVSVGSLAKTYDDFVAHITGLAVDGQKDWSTPVVAAGAFRTTIGVYSGAMYGSPYNGRFECVDNFSRAALPRAIQHSLPSAQAAAEGTQVFFRVQLFGGFYDLTGLDRNGYVSLSQAQRPAGAIAELIYWDGTQAQRMQPSLGLGPEPYLFTPPTPKTYADFQTHIRSKATSGFANWTTQTGVSASKFWTTAGPVGGSMVGSSWNGKMETSVAPCRAVQHAMQNQTLFDQQVAAGFDVYFETADGGFVGAFNSVSRNGYTSSGASGGPYTALIVPLLIRWDDTLKKAFQSNPSIGGSESEYTWS